MSLSFEGVIFDMDGVITNTAILHAEAWKATFDEYLKERAERYGEEFKEFTYEDYLKYVDGKPRYNGVNDFLRSRGIELPFGDPNDDPSKETVCGIGNRKNLKFRQLLEEKGVYVFQSTMDLVRELKAKGVKVAVVSSSKNCKLILTKAGVIDEFHVIVDGVLSAQLGLKGKPNEDIFVEAAARLGVHPSKAVVVEDATSGVEAGRNGGFGLVLGVARADNREELFKHGADIVVTDLSEIKVEEIDAWFRREPRHLFQVWDLREEVKDPRYNPHLFKSPSELFVGKPLIFFLDYDGTLTPIVSRPDLAVLSEDMRRVLKELDKIFDIAIVSGRMREDVENLVKIDDIFYAGSHGFDIKGPGVHMIHPLAKEFMPIVDEIAKEVKERLGHIEGMILEHKKFSVAVHYRLVKSEEDRKKIYEVVKEIASRYPKLRLMHGKMVYELLPSMRWDKGKAVRWIMNALRLSWDDVTAIYIGDDTTDEDAFRAIRTRGVGILVSERSRPSAAYFRLNNPDEVKAFFEKIISLCPKDKSFKVINSKNSVKSS